MGELDSKPDARPVNHGDLVAANWMPYPEWQFGIVEFNTISGQTLDDAAHVVLLKSYGDLDRLADDALQEAFNFIKDAFPEIVTGDFPPDAKMKIDKAIKEAITSWVQANYPRW